MDEGYPRSLFLVLDLYVYDLFAAFDESSKQLLAINSIIRYFCTSFVVQRLTRLSLFLTSAAALAMAGSSLLSVAAEVASELDPKIVKQCKDARDFQGCVKAFNNPASTLDNSSSKTSSEEKCDEDGICLAKAGIDIYGLSKVVGWKYKAYENGIHYWQPKIHKIKHKGKFGRYIGRKYTQHYYQQAIAGTSGYYNTIRSAKRTCRTNYYTGRYTCTTTPPYRVWVPGTTGRAGGPRSVDYVYVADCIDETYAYYYDGKLRGKWKKSNKGIYGCSKNENESESENVKGVFKDYDQLFLKL